MFTSVTTLTLSRDSSVRLLHLFTLQSIKRQQDEMLLKTLLKHFKSDSDVQLYIILKPVIMVWNCGLISSQTLKKINLLTKRYQMLSTKTCLPLSSADGYRPEQFIFNEVCAHKQDSGPCKARFERFFFNVETGKCGQFVYGGCAGNDNNFDTLEKCEETCVVTGEFATFGSHR